MSNYLQLSIVLYPGTTTPFNLTPYLSMETGAQLTSTIEKPTDLCNFTAPEVTLKGYDRSGTVKALFANILPYSTNWFVTIQLWANGYNDIFFKGFVAPQTLSFNAVEGSFTFTVVGMARALQMQDATPLFQRTAAPWYYSDGKWTLHSQASTNAFEITVQASGNPSVCDFQTGDTIGLTGVTTWTTGTSTGSVEELTVLSVVPDLSGTFFTLNLSAAPGQNYAAGTIILLVTLYQRNLSLQSVVGGLFAAAGVPTAAFFGTGALPNLGTMFMTPVNQAGITGSILGGAVPAPYFGLPIVVGTAVGDFYASSAASGFIQLGGIPGYESPDDPTNLLGLLAGGQYMGGAQYEYTRTGNAQYGVAWTLILYAYDYYSYIHSNAPQRYKLTITFDGTSGSPYSYTTLLEKQTALVAGNGFQGWNAPTTVWAGENSTTSTNLGPLKNVAGLGVDPLTGNVFFTDVTNGGVAGAALAINFSTVTYAGALTRNIASGVWGPITITMNVPNYTTTYLQIFQTNGNFGKPANILTYAPGSGSVTYIGSTPMTGYVATRTLRYNGGDGKYYAISYDDVGNINLCKFTMNANGTLSAPTVTAVGSGYYVYDTYLMVIQNAGAGTWPMILTLGGVLYYLGLQGSGLIAYANMDGMAIGDALAELSVMAGAVFYEDALGATYTFRTRNTMPPSYDISGGVASEQLDTLGIMMSDVTQPIFASWVGYVSVQNEDNQAIFGDTSNVVGSFAYANSLDTSLSLQIQSRYVNTSVLAAALANSIYNYLGAKKRWIEVIVLRDGKHYFDVGRTFHLNLDGANRQFQIIEQQVSIFGATLKIAALEI